MSIPGYLIRQTEELLGTRISEIEIPNAGVDHVLFAFKVASGQKLIAKAEHNAVVDALVLEHLKHHGVDIPVPQVVAYSESNNIAVFEFVEGQMLESLPGDDITRLLPEVLQIANQIHTIKSDKSGTFNQVRSGKGASWKEFFGAKYQPAHPYYKWDKLLADNKFNSELIAGQLTKVRHLSAQLLESEEASLLHSDLHGDNILTRNGEIAAVIDWSDANFGDPLYDFSRIRLFIVGNDQAREQIYYDFLGLTAEEKQREELYYLGHTLRKLFVAWNENIERLMDKNYKRLLGQI